MLAAAVAAVSCDGSKGSPAAPTPPASGVVRYFTGNRADVAPQLFGPAHDFGGGGSDVNDSIQWMIDTVRGCTGCAAATLD